MGNYVSEWSNDGTSSNQLTHSNGVLLFDISSDVQCFGGTFKKVSKKIFWSPLGYLSSLKYL